MTEQEIREGAPSGASGYAEYNGCIYYFMMSSYGWRQIKGNIIQFDDSYMDDLIKPL